MQLATLNFNLSNGRTHSDAFRPFEWLKLNFNFAQLRKLRGTSTFYKIIEANDAVVDIGNILS